jgi:hypothetical protein
MKHDHDRLPLRQAIREHVAAERLDAGELAALRRLSQGAPERPARRRLLAAAAAVAGTAVLGYWGSGRQQRIDHDNAQRMADEIAYNHLAASPLDVVGSELATMHASFASLGFSLLDAQAIEGVPGELIGGRFCSVASVPAALLRYRSEHGITTVYQARFDPAQHRGAADVSAGEHGVIRHARGVSVCLCNVQGVLLAVASQPSPAVA